MIFKLTEADVAEACDKLALQLNYEVQRYEQRRASKIHRGISDRRYVQRLRCRLWVELKNPDGKMTESQYRWIMDELAAGGMAVCIDSVHVLAPLLQDIQRGSSAIDAAARRRMKEITDLIAQRGFRKESS